MTYQKETGEDNNVWVEVVWFEEKWSEEIISVSVEKRKEGKGKVIFA